MRLISNSILVLLLFFNCTSDVDVQTAEMQPPLTDVLTDVLTLEFTIGESSNLQYDFILAEPRIMMVNNNDDILVIDEDRIKVFDSAGKEKNIFGRPGEGPGEYSRTCGYFLSPEGYLTVLDASGRSGGSDGIEGYRYDIRSTLNNYYNLFAPDYSFLEKKMLGNVLKLNEYLESKKIDIKSDYSIRKVFALNETEKIYEIQLKDPDPDSDVKYFTIILYENANTCKPVLHTKMPGTGAGGAPEDMLGEIHWTLIPGRNLLYVNTLEDDHNEQTVSRYTIHVISLDTFEDTKIYRAFTPFLIPKKEKERHIEVEKMFEKRRREIFSRMGREAPTVQCDTKKDIRIIKAQHYYPSITRIRVDRNYAFVFTVDRTETTRKKIENIITSVIDLNIGECTAEVKLPFIPKVIMNGYAYWIGRDEEGFYEVRKYKIDPAVYGK